MDPGVDSDGGHHVDHATDDPSALFDDQSVAPFAELARQLSARSDWLQPKALDLLRHSALRLDEAFPAAPAFLDVGGVTYKIRIEPFGEDARSLDPGSEPWYVFLSPEVYAGLGEDRFLAFQDGVETVLHAQDLEQLPTVGLTLAGLSGTERPQPGERVASMTSRLELGQASTAAFESRRLLAAAGDGRAAQKNACAGVAPTGCHATRPVCGTGQEPFFVLDAIKINVKHERRGSSPEIELFPLQQDNTLSLGGNNETEAIFDGRFVDDLAGRSRYLPDINTTGTFHTISGGYALFPTNIGTEWTALLVEDDRTTGELDVNSNLATTIKVFTTGVNAYSASATMNAFKLLTASWDLMNLLFLNNGDDCFDDLIGIDNALFCNGALGQPFPSTVVLDTTEWSLRGHVACIDTSCSPSPPPLEASVSGPSALDPWEVGTYTCTASSGTPPYTYTWHKGYGSTGPVVGSHTTSATSHSIGLADTIDFQVTCDLGDSVGGSDSAVKSIVVEANSTGCDPVQCNATCGGPGLGQCLLSGECVCG
ncbi:MAG: hypothetical protein AAGE94_07100 [Acidobacteriota bacterium]